MKGTCRGAGSPSDTSGHQEHRGWGAGPAPARRGHWDLGWGDLWMAQRALSYNFPDYRARCILCIVTDALKSFCAAPVASGRGHRREMVAHDGY